MHVCIGWSPSTDGPAELWVANAMSDAMLHLVTPLSTMFKSAATKIAHNSTIPALAGNKDLRPLQDLITAEKAIVTS
jgi:hypothetical protein